MQSENTYVYTLLSQNIKQTHKAISKCNQTRTLWVVPNVYFVLDWLFRSVILSRHIRSQTVCCHECPSIYQPEWSISCEMLCMASPYQHATQGHCSGTLIQCEDDYIFLHHIVDAQWPHKGAMYSCDNRISSWHISEQRNRRFHVYCRQTLPWDTSHNLVKHMYNYVYIMYSIYMRVWVRGCGVNMSCCLAAFDVSIMPIIFISCS